MAHDDYCKTCDRPFLEGHERLCSRVRELEAKVRELESQIAAARG